MTQSTYVCKPCIFVDVFFFVLLLTSTLAGLTDFFVSTSISDSEVELESETDTAGFFPLPTETLTVFEGGFLEELNVLLDLALSFTGFVEAITSSTSEVVSLEEDFLFFFFLFFSLGAFPLVALTT